MMGYGDDSTRLPFSMAINQGLLESLWEQKRMTIKCVCWTEPKGQISLLKPTLQAQSTKITHVPGIRSSLTIVTALEGKRLIISHTLKPCTADVTLPCMRPSVIIHFTSEPVTFLSISLVLYTVLTKKRPMYYAHVNNASFFLLKKMKRYRIISIANALKRHCYFAI